MNERGAGTVYAVKLVKPVVTTWMKLKKLSQLWAWLMTAYSRRKNIDQYCALNYISTTWHTIFVEAFGNRSGGWWHEKVVQIQGEFLT